MTDFKVKVKLKLYFKRQPWRPHCKMAEFKIAKLKNCACPPYW